MKKHWVMNDFITHIGAIFAATVVILLPIFGNKSFEGVTRDEGFFLLILLFFWLWVLFNRKISEDEDIEYKAFTFATSIIMVIAGVIGVFIGGQWVVGGAITIATLLNVGPELIGLTLVAIGTSLPELTVSVVALFKRSPGIAVGNIIGSSVLNFLGIIGVTALIKPISTFSTVQFDIFTVLYASVALFVLMFIGKKYTLGRFEGLFFITAYLLYIIFIIIRG